MSELRQRKPTLLERAEEIAKNPVVTKIRRFDLYPKTPDYIQQKSYTGAAISIAAAAFMLFLFVSQFLMFLEYRRSDTLTIDLEKSGKIPIFFNITFPSVKCPELSIDAVDTSGVQQIDMYHLIFKAPIDKTGRIISKKHVSRKLLPEMLDQPKDDSQNPQSPFYCGNCFPEDSVPTPGLCCNTCEDVIRQHRITNRSPPPLSEIDQCIDEVSVSHPGCNIYGAFRVNKVNGNFHFAPGRSYVQEHDTHVHHIHEYNPVLVNRFNSSHIIHQLWFGPRIPHVIHPLDNTAATVTEGAALYKYFVKVVPTTYQKGSGSVQYSNQFSVTRHAQRFNPKFSVNIPGVFFVYDLSPITINYRDTRTPFLHFIVSLCAVIGGVFTVSGYAEKFIHSLSKRLLQKDSLSTVPRYPVDTLHQ